MSIKNTLKKWIIIGSIAWATLLPLWSKAQTTTTKTKDNLIENVDEENHQKIMNTYVFVIFKNCNNNKEELTKLIKKHMIIEINKIRKEHNLLELKENEKLNKISQDHAEDMLKNWFYSHTNKKNENPFKRAENIWLGQKYIVENIDKWSVTLQQVINEMRMESKHHRQNILEQYITDIWVGFDLWEDDEITSIHWVLNMAKIINQ